MAKKQDLHKGERFVDIDYAIAQHLASVELEFQAQAHRARYHRLHHNDCCQIQYLARRHVDGEAVERAWASQNSYYGQSRGPTTASRLPTLLPLFKVLFVASMFSIAF
ncbi:hypothetical protein B0H16DRAFT_1747397 [Mycena metata]|uniref:Uncharacterized protein n=1 Tax=Mycena metata TaxID=1033252 RepID=A0AAD7M803_9AGAR|nr:hypothetical protein B0H16DRAFT_1747397 [Mycena metata]